MSKREVKTATGKVYGYLRISQKKQSIERQRRNVIAYNENAIIFEEAYTGTKVAGRTEFNKLLKKVEAGDTIVFDSVSRMSRNAQEGIELYEELYEKGVSLVFLKEPYINTDVYKSKLEAISIPDVDSKALKPLLRGLEETLRELAREQIEIAFNQAEKEVMDLRQRTIEGLKTARKNGSKIGSEKGVKKNTKRGQEIKEFIKKYASDFGGSMQDKEIMDWKKIGRNTYYKYKKELLVEAEKGE